MKNFRKTAVALIQTSFSSAEFAAKKRITRREQFPGSAPDATTLLKFRRLLETNELTQRMFVAINATLAERGLLIRSGTIVNATIINFQALQQASMICS